MAINPLAKELIIRFNINRFIETGIWKGDTMTIVDGWFKELKMDYFMFEIDSSEEYCKNAVKLGNPNILVLQGSSDMALRQLMWRWILPWDRVMIYLDAHWEEYWPLRDELKQVLDLKNKPIILIDDYKTPGRAYGYDTYHWNDCGTEYIKDLIKDRVEKVYIFDKPNKDNRTSGILFLDRTEEEIDKMLEGIPVIKEELY